MFQYVLDYFSGTIRGELSSETQRDGCRMPFITCDIVEADSLGEFIRLHLLGE